MLRCSNQACQFCQIDPVDQRLICSDVPDFMQYCTDLEPFLLRCKRFKQRNPKTLIEIFTALGTDDLSHLMDKDGLFAGQIKAPIDYSDFDPEGEPDVAPGPETCKT